MKRQRLTMVFMFVAALSGRQAFAQCSPGAGQAAFFVDSNFSGACVTRTIGNYPTAASIGLANDSISSIRVGPATQVYVCRDDYYQGQCELFTASDPNLGNKPIGNDTISSAKVQPLGSSTSCVPSSNQVAFFRDANFAGPCVVRGIGNYPTPQSIGLPNDSISSFLIGKSAQVAVCRDAAFGGDCETFTASRASMNGTRIGNDAISSAKVQGLGTQECAPGPLQAAFFMHRDFVGPCSIRNLGEYPTAAAFGLPNDSMSSVLVGQGAQAVLCVDNNFNTDCQRFASSVADLGGQRIGNDTVSSAKVQRLGTVECTPQANQVAFYMHADFVGPCRTLGIGQYPNSQPIGLPNDSISSFMVGSGVQAVLCVDNDFRGDCQKFTASRNNMDGTRIGNDQTSSVRVLRPGDVDCPPAANQAAVYMHADFLFPCVVKGVGDYPTAAAIGLDDKSITSIRVGSQVQACVCTGEQFTTFCQALTSDNSDLFNSTIGNDNVSSMKVTNRGAACQAVQPAPVGYSEVDIYNCSTDMRSVTIWIRDVTIGEPFHQQGGTLAPNYSGGSCLPTTQLSIPLQTTHLFAIIAVDPQKSGCNGRNDPNVIDCQRQLSPLIQGDPHGIALPYPVN